MILSLIWKEYREHRSIWLTMVITTGMLAFGLAQLMSPRDAELSQVTMPAIAALGLAAAYGIVCGAMMFAGEWEAGTMVFLDIFLGRRSLLWIWKFAIGALLAASEGLAVGLTLHYLKVAPPDWLSVFIGRGRSIVEVGGNRGIEPISWMRILPLLTFEAFAWGLLGSALTRFVLTGAALAAVIAAPVYLVALLSPPELSLGIRVVAAIIALLISCSVFVTQTREPSQGSLLQTVDVQRPVPWVLLEEDFIDAPAREGRRSIPVRAEEIRRDPADLVRRGPRPPNADSPLQVLCWLTMRQAALPLGVLAGVGFLLGFFIPAHGQVLWPIATLLLGVACGTAAFAGEQGERSYQFLAAQHFPLDIFWRVKILFWLGVAVLGILALSLGSGLAVLAQHASRFPVRGEAARGIAGISFGTLRELMGPILFFGVWFAYGFAAGQVFVLLCRKAILAVLLSGMVSATALALWLPTLLCGGTIGWQLWLPPLAMLAATRLLMRAWAGDRIKERRPLALLMGFGVAGLAWTALNLGYRVWEVPDAEEPLNRAAFRASIPRGKDNEGGRKIQAALAAFDQGPWLERLAEAAKSPTGVLDNPPTDGPSPAPSYLRTCQLVASGLMEQAEHELPNDPTAAFQRVAQTLALSRTMRNKASLASYVSGVNIEQKALETLELFVIRAAPEHLGQLLADFNRHAAETPPPLDCLQTECFRAGGVLKNPTSWSFYSGREAAGRVPEGWLAGGIALSLELPWEQERKSRLWRLVWQGLFRGMQTPHWELPATPPDPGNVKMSTRQVLHGWLPARDGPESAMTLEQLAKLIDSSWLSDERLFAPVVPPLRSAATRARWRVDAARLKLALGLYQMEQKKPAAKLSDLVPKYLPQLPVDPYSGQMFGYRLSPGEDMVMGEGNAVERVQPGQAILWSTGPDRIDHGGRTHGGMLADDDHRWQSGQLDLVTIVPKLP